MKYLLAVAILSGSFLIGATAHADNGQMCYELYQPVCAAQQVECFAAPCYPQYHTYSNSCFAANANAPIIHDGECTASETGSYTASTTPVSTPPAKPYTPPAGCTAWFDGCNSCSMQPSGHAICTEMACSINNSAKGYCRAYAATSTPVKTPPVSPIHPTQPVISTTTSTSSPAMATATASSTVVATHGFFYTLWHTILSWFGIK
jgi:hypothetical protein